MDKVDQKMKENLKKEIGVRMRKIRKALSYTQEQMVANFNIGRANYSRIEKGEVLPNAAVLNCLRMQFGISLDWLISNSGKMFVRNEAHEREKRERKKLVDFGEYSKEVQELLTAMDKVPMVKHAILGFFLEYVEKHKDFIQRLLKKSDPAAKTANDVNDAGHTGY